MHPLITDLSRFIIDTLIPVRCVVCRREYPKALCPSCIQSLAPARLTCVVCKKPALAGLTHRACRTRTTPLQQFSLYDYQDERVARSIIAGKYNLVADAFCCFAPLLGTACVTHCIHDPRSIVCPVPLHKRRLAWRGFNQAEILASGIAAALCVPLIPALGRTRYTQQQKDLRAAEREKNVQHCFAVSEEHAARLHGAHVLLVDDVYTTGHTLFAAAHALQEAGVAHISFITLAKE